MEGICMKIIQLSALCIVSMLCLTPVVASAQPYVISADGTEATDKKTGLIWRRCAEGMKWVGKTCVGEAKTFTHVAALQLATDLSASTGITWRLPNKDELISIVDTSRTNPAINVKIFPATPAKPFWADSPPHVRSDMPQMTNSQFGWSVNFDDGYLYQRYYRNDNCLVRLVRTGK